MCIRDSLRILEALQEDATLSNIELAERVCLSPTPCARRVRILEEGGYFRGRVSLLNPEKINLPVSVFIQVNLSHQVKNELEGFEGQISEWPEVMECYLITGDFDYLLRVVVSDLNSYQRFLEDKLTRVKGIDNIKSSFSLKAVQYRTALPLDHLKSES